MKPQIITKVICHHDSDIHTAAYLEFSSPSWFLPTRSHAAVTALAPGCDLVLTGACPVCGATVKRLIESEPVRRNHEI